MKFYKLRSILNKRGFRCTPLVESGDSFSFKPTPNSIITQLKDKPEIIGLLLDNQQGAHQYKLEEANLIPALLMHLEKPEVIEEIPADEMQGFINFSRENKSEDAEEIRD